MIKDCIEKNQPVGEYLTEVELDLDIGDQDQDSDLDHNPVKPDLWEEEVYIEISAQVQDWRIDLLAGAEIEEVKVEIQKKC